MARFHVVALLAVLLSSSASAGSPADVNQLPELNLIRTATLSPSYSCRDRAAFDSGYQQTALFLSGYSRKRNAPDLLFNGACGSDDYFTASTAGDDMALIADLGSDIALEDVTPQLAWRAARMAKHENETRYTLDAPVVVGHVYAVMLNKSDVRGLFVFAVTGYEKNQSVTIRYAVKSYAVNTTLDVAPGFKWDAGSRESLEQEPRQPQSR